MPSCHIKNNIIFRNSRANTLKCSVAYSCLDLGGRASEKWPIVICCDRFGMELLMWSQKFHRLTWKFKQCQGVPKHYITGVLSMYPHLSFTHPRLFLETIWRCALARRIFHTNQFTTPYLSGIFRTRGVNRANARWILGGPQLRIFENLPSCCVWACGDFNWDAGAAGGLCQAPWMQWNAGFGRERKPQARPPRNSPPKRPNRICCGEQRASQRPSRNCLPALKGFQASFYWKLGSKSQRSWLVTFQKRQNCGFVNYVFSAVY